MPHKDPEIQRAYRREYYKKHRAEAIARAKAWREIPGNMERRNFTERQRNAERLRIDPEFRERRRQHSRDSYRRHRAKRLILAAKHRLNEKAKARELLRAACRRGEIVRPATCDACGKRARLHGHHSDYSQPLVVVWLCPLCHGEIHRSHAS